MGSANGVAETSEVHVRLFGSIALLCGKDEVDIPRPQLRRLVASLALRAGTPVPAERLIDEVWGEQALPVDPRASLRVAVARLRKLLGTAEPSLTSASGNYQLDCTSDLTLIEHCLSALDADPSSETRHAALDLVERTSDEPLDDLASTPEYEHYRERCSADRRELIAKLGRALTDAGDHDRSAGLLREPHRESPGREDLTWCYATSLAALGRKADALAAITTTRDHLRNELGLPISTQLSETEMDILQGVADLGFRPAPTPRSSESTTFVGRSAELQRLTTHDAGPVMVVGVAGIGKTALLEHAAATLQESTDLLFVAVPESSNRPMGTIAALIEQVLDHPSTDEALCERARALHRLVPHRVEELPGNTGPSGRDELLAAATSFLVDHLHGTGAILVLDDCHWLDQGSSEVLRGVLDADVHTRFIGAMRPEPSPFANLLSDQHVIHLGPLQIDSTREFLSAQSTRPPDDEVVATLHTRSGGSPLFLSMLVEHNDEGALTDTHLPPTVLAAVQQRVTDLSLRARQTLRNASVIEGPFTPELLNELSADPARDLTEAVELELLWRDPNGELVFPHALMREAIEQLLPKAQRVAAHDAVGRALVDRGAPAAQYARHFVETAELDPQRAVESTLVAACEAASAFDWPSCGEFARRALDIGDERGGLDAEDHADLLLLLGMSLRRTNQENDEILLAAADAALITGDDRRIVEAVIELCSHGSTSMSGTVHPMALEKLNAALAQDLNPLDRARLQAAATPLVSNSKLEGWGRELYLEALRTVAEHDNPEVETEVLLHSHLGLTHPDDLSTREANGRRLSELGANDPDARWESAFLLLHAAICRGEPADADLGIKQLREETPRLKYRNRDLGLSFSESAYATLYGRFDEAEHHAWRVFELGEGFSPSWAQLIGGGALAALFHAQGRLAELRGYVDDQLADLPDFPTFVTLSALVAVAENDRERARRDLADLIDGDRVVLPEVDLPALVLPCFVAETIRFLEDAALARPHYEWLKRYEDRFVWSGIAPHGSLHRYLGGLAETFGDTDAARRHFDSADTAMARFGVEYVGGEHLAQYRRKP